MQRPTRVSIGLLYSLIIRFLPNIADQISILHPIQITWTQLGERNDGSPVPKAESWGESSKQSVCSYNSASGKKAIDILGIYSGVSMLDKTF